MPANEHHRSCLFSCEGSCLFRITYNGPDRKRRGHIYMKKTNWSWVSEHVEVDFSSSYFIKYAPAFRSHWTCWTIQLNLPFTRESRTEEYLTFTPWPWASACMATCKVNPRPTRQVKIASHCNCRLQRIVRSTFIMTKRSIHIHLTLSHVLSNMCREAQTIVALDPLNRNQKTSHQQLASNNC